VELEKRLEAEQEYVFHSLRKQVGAVALGFLWGGT
jgi:hypothetical protein